MIRKFLSKFTPLTLATCTLTLTIEHWPLVISRFSLVFSLWSIVFSLPSLAVDQSFFSTKEGIATVSSSPIITIGYVMQLFFSLLVVIGLIYITAKFLLPKIKTSTKSNFITVIDKIVLEPQVTSYIIKVKNTSWLIVISNKQVAKIDKLEGDY